MTVGKFIGGVWQSEFRIVEINGMFSPQQGYLVRGEHRWFSLLRNGYWADPDGYNLSANDGEDVVVLMQTREMADAAIAAAKRINAAPAA